MSGERPFPLSNRELANLCLSKRHITKHRPRAYVNYRSLPALQPALSCIPSVKNCSTSSCSKKASYAHRVIADLQIEFFLRFFKIVV